MYAADDISSKALKVVLIHLLEVIILNLAFNVFMAFGSCVFFQIFLSSSVRCDSIAPLRHSYTLISRYAES